MANPTICRIEGCSKTVYKNKMCNAHNLRARRHGNPELGRRSPGSNNCGKNWCPAAKKIFAHIHYIQNSNEYKKRAKDWHLKNPEAKTSYLSKTEVKIAARTRTRKWNAANPERKRQMDLEFAEKNKALVTSYKAKRRATLRQAMPSWLTQDQILQIRAIYAEAKRLSDETGVPHDVDHIVPLAGKIVSGLHVPWNLRAIPKIENNRRPRIYQID